MCTVQSCLFNADWPLYQNLPHAFCIYARYTRPRTIEFGEYFRTVSYKSRLYSDKNVLYKIYYEVCL